ncbi:hypothetical protein H1C71_041062 [Ictidomys tridecemlineatus]|nr:hypothetical protein H1C71_041062 [Ictidomys tridecemlineatus]
MNITQQVMLNQGLDLLWEEMDILIDSSNLNCLQNLPGLYISCMHCELSSGAVNCGTAGISLLMVSPVMQFPCQRTHVNCGNAGIFADGVTSDAIFPKELSIGLVSWHFCIFLPSTSDGLKFGGQQR